jgi:hypothetical protein
MQEDMMRSCTLLRLLLLLLPGLLRALLLDGTACCTFAASGEAACLPLPATGAVLCAD